MTNREKLIGFVAAGTKIDQAARMLREAAIDIARVDVGYPRERLQTITAELNALVEGLSRAIQGIPST